MNILIFFIILFVLVIVHEFGHFSTAKKFGIRVDEFGFGFPPKLFGWKKGETEYTLNALPFGGFVKIFGDTPDAFNALDDQTINSADYERSFIGKPKWQQAIVLFAGVFANFVLAWLLFSVGFMSGLPTSVGSQSEGQVLKNIHLVVVSVLPNSPAQDAGLKSGDKIIKVESGQDSIPEINPDTLKSFILAHPNEELQIEYLRGKEESQEVAVKPKVNENGKPAIGISMDQIGTAKLSLIPALFEGLRLSLFLTKATAVGLFTFITEGITGRGSLDDVTGPVGLVGIVGDAYEFGFAYLLSFAALISINLAIINLLPFPALDGGRLFFLLIEKIKGSPLNQKAVNMANIIGFSVLIIFMLVITFKDVAKLL